MPNPGPASTITEHPLGGGGGPAYLGTSGGAVGFYQDAFGGLAVTQRASAVQQIITVSQTAGILCVFQSNSQKEPTLTANNISAMAITLTGAPMVSTGDIVFINKQIPTPQFGVAGVRVSTSSPSNNTAILILTGANLNTSGVSTTTPTGDRFIATAIRGSLVNSVTLTPTVVAASSTVEQQFTVTGVAPGMLVPIVKPTEQQGLGIGGTRVVSNNVLGVTFINVGNTAITPSSETYLYSGLAGIAAISPWMTAGVGMSQASVASLTVTGGNGVGVTLVTVTGVQVQDQAIGFGQGILAPLSGIAPVLAQVSANAANFLNLQFASNVSTGTTTASSTDTYLIPMLRSNCEAPMTIYPATFPGANIGPNTCTEIAVTVTGITVSCAILVSKPSFTTGVAILGSRVSAAATAGSTIAINFGNPTNATVAVPIETYTVGAFKPLFGVGHYTQQLISPLNVQSVALTNEMRNTLAGTQLFAGS